MKIWGWVALAGIVIAALGAAYKASYNAGYNARDKELMDEQVAAQNQAIKKGIQDWIDTQEAAEPVIIVEEKIVEKIRVVNKEIPKIVEKIVTVHPECRDLGPDYVGLLNEQIRAANQSRLPDADPSAELVEGVSGVQ